MTKRSDETAKSQANGVFRTTHWTEIFVARSKDEPRRREALHELLVRYWKPIYYYLRCKGHAHEAAKDLTQGFFHEVVLGKGLIQKADRAKGRFRTFLLTALSRYRTSIRRAETAKQRMPEGGLISMEEIDGEAIPEPVLHTTPSKAFEYAWATALLDQVLDEVAGKCRQKGLATHWRVFRARVVEPTLDNADTPSLTQLCQKYGIPNEAKASHMILTIRRRFRAALREHVRQLVESDAEVEDEIRHLMKVFSRS